MLQDLLSPASGPSEQWSKNQKNGNPFLKLNMAQKPENREKGRHREREKGGLKVSCDLGSVAGVAVAQLVSMCKGRGEISSEQLKGVIMDK